MREHCDSHFLLFSGASSSLTYSLHRTIESLEALSDDPAVHRIFPVRYLRKRMDVASAKVHVPAFRTASQLTGKGVVIGIVDTGIDPNHPAFKKRIARVWDQMIDGGMACRKGATGSSSRGHSSRRRETFSATARMLPASHPSDLAK